MGKKVKNIANNLKATWQRTDPGVKYTFLGIAVSMIVVSSLVIAEKLQK